MSRISQSQTGNKVLDVFKYIQNDVVNGFVIHILLETANFAIRYEVKIIYPY